MTTETNPNGETPQAAPQVEATPDLQAPAPAEEFDKERAMNTIRNLRDFEKKAKADLKELETLRAEKQQRAEAEMTEAQRVQKKADELAAENAKLKSDLLRSKVVAEVNLPSIFTERLQGSTYEELLADAQKLAELLPKQPTTKTAPTLNATNPANGQPVETEAQQRERLFGKPGRVFDLEAIKAAGGGVFWNKPPEQT